MLRLKIIRLIVTVFVFLGATSMKAQDSIKWMTFSEMETAMEKEPKKVFVDFWTSWCGWCKRMDATTFKDPEIVTYINEHFYPVKFNAEEKETITFRGTEFKFKALGRRGYNELAYQVLSGKMSYPSYSFLEEESVQVITTVKGYQEPDQLLPILKFIGDKHYKNTSWKAYKSTLKSD